MIAGIAISTLLVGWRLYHVLRRPLPSLAHREDELADNL